MSGGGYRDELGAAQARIAELEEQLAEARRELDAARSREDQRARERRSEVVGVYLSRLRFFLRLTGGCAAGLTFVFGLIATSGVKPASGEPYQYVLYPAVVAVVAFVALLVIGSAGRSEREVGTATPEPPRASTPPLDASEARRELLRIIAHSRRPDEAPPGPEEPDPPAESARDRFAKRR